MLHTVTDRTAPGVVCARVIGVLEHGERLAVSLTDGSVIECRRLHVSDGAPAALAAGDDVLVQHDGDQGVVLGRIGPSSAAKLPSHVAADTEQSPHAKSAVPDELVIEAKQALTLRVGEGSITIREDGKILIKGKDLVSHAQRMNRIKGGAVSIN